MGVFSRWFHRNRSQNAAPTSSTTAAGQSAIQQDNSAVMQEMAAAGTEKDSLLGGEADLGGGFSVDGGLGNYSLNNGLPSGNAAQGNLNYNDGQGNSGSLGLSWGDIGLGNLSSGLDSSGNSPRRSGWLGVIPNWVNQDTNNDGIAENGLSGSLPLPFGLSLNYSFSTQYFNEPSTTVVTYQRQ